MQEMNVAMSSHPLTIFAYILLPALHLAWGNKAEIRAFPSKVVKKGDDVTIRCSGPYNQGTFRLERTNNKYSDSEATDVNAYDFTVTDVQDNSAYSCRQFSNAGWSGPSDPLTLQVIDPQKPNISCVQDNSEDTKLQITCRAPDPPEGCSVKRFHLYSGRVLITDLPVKESSPQVTFKVSNPSKEYSCSYVVEVKEQPNQVIEAPISDEVTARKCNDFSDVNERKGTWDEEETIPIDDDVLIPAVAASCGILMLILIVILVVYFMRKNKSSTQKMKNGDFHHSEKAETTTDATYCTVDKNRVRATPDVEVDMRDTTLDGYDDNGITYATLNKISLNQKSTQPDVPVPTDTSLYAEVKKSGPK
ncbi:leukocyte immunoglobulin-like receptor subfamily B member 4 isoform X2 [Eleutherodactylus coqui]|uniref:leukocyte immunoglobulin-like receptor subfamily B member 4 isoform X2 n=1 Tax=Eleutherodactylus coqui TaxID=57060 RepID=UPI003461F5AB